MHAPRKEFVWTFFYVRYVACLVGASTSCAFVQAQLLSSYILKPTLLYHVVPGVAAMVGALLHNRVKQDFWDIDECL